MKRKSATFLGSLCAASVCVLLLVGAGAYFFPPFFSAKESSVASPGVSAPVTLKVPVFVYHLVRPLDPGDSRSIHQYDVEPRVFEA